ncbi:MAG: response regulator [Colwellia sp.]
MNCNTLFLDEIRLQAKILIVDDEPHNTLLLKRLLEGNGYSNVTCELNSTKVLALHTEHQYELILLDFMMPELDGFGVLQQISQLPTPLPAIIMLTADVSHDLKLKVLNNGVRDFLTKPFELNELLIRVKNILDVHLAHQYMLNQNDILERKVKERTEEIHKNQLNLIRCLGLAAEYRDEETGLHIIRMSKFAVVIAKAIGMNEKDINLLLHAAPMHDIGKIGIPDSILQKPGKFTQPEWDKMKEHAQIGADILIHDESELMNMAKEIALTHHEKWNGTGYPNGLKAEEIPLVGRIAALADVFDALTSIRPYKKAWTVKDAMELIESERGEHFDPTLVDALIANLPDIIEIKERHKEI